MGLDVDDVGAGPLGLKYDNDATKIVNQQTSKNISLDDWGYPGYLTPSQNKALRHLEKEFEKRDHTIRSAVFSYPGVNEDLSSALCRWLRSCQFDVCKTMKKIEESFKYSYQARANGFYEDQDKALGVERSIYLQQFPQLYHGKSKAGTPVMISQLGKLNNKGAECVTTVERVINFHWSEMVHTFGNQLKRYASDGRKPTRCELVMILDLDGLTSSQLTKKIMHIIKTQCFIDELCFPESLNRMICINSPAFFTFIWKIVRGWVDPRNGGKVELYGTNKHDWINRLHQLIDKSELPSDYGGTCKSVSELLKDRMIDDYKKKGRNHLGILHQDTTLLNVNGRASHCIVAEQNKIIRLALWTNSKGSATVVIKDKNGTLDCMPSNGIHLNFVQHSMNGGHAPRQYNLDDYNIVLQGPGVFTIEIVTDCQKKASFLLVETVYESNGFLTERVDEGPGINFRRSLSLGYGTYRDNREGRDDDIDLFNEVEQMNINYMFLLKK